MNKHKPWIFVCSILIFLLVAGNSILPSEEQMPGSGRPGINAVPEESQKPGEKSLTLAEGDRFSLASLLDEETKEEKTVWYSADEEVASVSSDGTVTAGISGVTTIVAKTGEKKIRYRIYVASFSSVIEQMMPGEVKKVEVIHTGDSLSWTSSDKEVATVSEDGTIHALNPGETIIECTAGRGVLTFALTVQDRDNIVTKRTNLPKKTNKDSLRVTINSYPQKRVYAIYKQNGKGNLSKQFPRYMPGHGCSASSLACVLSAYAGFTHKPFYLVEKIEKDYFGEAWEKNYSKKDTDDSKSRPMPISLYGMTKILDGYGIKHEYVRAFDDQKAEREIEIHLKTGNPVIFIVSGKSRFAGARKNKWTTGYHCMTMLGMTDEEEVIVADTVDRSREIFGKNQRIKYAPLKELVGYMFSCKNTTSTSVYWNGRTSSGGYILINPQK